MTTAVGSVSCSIYEKYSMPVVRKVVVSIEDIHMEAGRALAQSGRKVVAAAVIGNPFAGGTSKTFKSWLTLEASLGSCWLTVRLKLLAKIAQLRATGRLPSWAAEARLSMGRRFCIRGWGSRSVRLSVRASPSFPLQPSAQSQVLRSTFHCISRTMNEALIISMPLLSASWTRRQTTRLFYCQPCQIGVAPLTRVKKI